jgi:hypothetical protein
MQFDDQDNSQGFTVTETGVLSEGTDLESQASSPGLGASRVYRRTVGGI